MKPAAEKRSLGDAIRSAAGRQAGRGLAPGARYVPAEGVIDLHAEEGSNLIEMALVLPVYFLLIFTLISFAIVLFAYCNASYASKAGVRYAIVHSATSVTPCGSTDVQNIVSPFLWGAPTGGTTITTQWPSGNTIGGTVSVTVQLAYSTGMPYGYLNNLVVSTTAAGTILH